MFSFICDCYGEAELGWGEDCKSLQHPDQVRVCKPNQVKDFTLSKEQKEAIEIFYVEE